MDLNEFKTSLIYKSEFQDRTEKPCLKISKKKKKTHLIWAIQIKKKKNLLTSCSRRQYRVTANLKAWYVIVIKFQFSF